VEKKQYDLCVEILKRLSGAGVLSEFILIGSWCVYFYRNYFPDISYMEHASFRTRDLDFLISRPERIERESNIPDLLKDLGFIRVFEGSKGYIKLQHPDLILEFLVPERGRGTDKPYPLPKLGMNAVALRFLDLLSSDTIRIRVGDVDLTLPHPANFALHKLIVFQRRTRKDKAAKDRNAAIGVLKALIRKGDTAVLLKVFDSIPRKWKSKVLRGLAGTGETEIEGILRI